MEISVGGSGAPRVVPTPGFEMRTVSVSADGRTVAGQCVDRKDDSAQVCLASPGGSGVKRLPGNEPGGKNHDGHPPRGSQREPRLGPKARKPCLAFGHFERPQGASIHIACLSPEPVVVAAAPVGSMPVWLPEP